MPKPLPAEGTVFPAEALRFQSVADEVMRRPAVPARTRARAAAETETPHIGTLREKRLHAIVKAYLCPDTACHERPVGDLPSITATDAAQKGKASRMVADILTVDDIFEVQTGGFYPLREKLAWYLENTDCRVTVVHPMAAVKYLSWLDPATGDVLSRHRSPKRARVKDVARELYWLRDFVGHDRFSLRLLFLEIEEYRLADGWSRDGKRGSNRYERFPTALLGDVTLSTPADYAAYFLPAALTAPDAEGQPPLFTAADYEKASGIKGKATYSTLHLLEALTLIRQSEDRRGRSRLYQAMP